MKKADTNYLVDYNQMVKLGCANFINEHNSITNCVLASRNISTTDYNDYHSESYRLWWINQEGLADFGLTFWTTTNGGYNSGSDYILSFRPVLTLPPDMMVEVFNSKDSENEAVDNPITQLNVAEHIGEYIDLGTNIVNKEGTTHKADWRIFDADLTGVYAILADYLPIENLPTTMKVSDDENAKDVIINKNANGLTIGWMSYANGELREHTDAVGTLLTASNWNFLAPSSKFNGKITGSPTYQQFAKSWNKVNNSIATMGEKQPGLYSNLIDSKGLYTIADTRSNTIYGNWLASTANGTSRIRVWYIKYDGSIDYIGCFNSVSYYGIRPLIYITSDIKITGQDENGVWHIVE